MSEATVRSFSSCCSEHFRAYLWKSPYINNDCLWKLCLYLDFLTDFLVDIYEIFNINNSSNLDYLMWFKEGINLEDSNFDMENYSSLVDVKLLLKIILDGQRNKLLRKKIIDSKVQLAPPMKNIIMAVLTSKSVIQLRQTDLRQVESWIVMLHSFVSTIANIYLAEKKMGIVNWPIEGKKQYFCQTIATHKNVHRV